MRRHYIFTDKRESKKGILSAMLGAMSLISVFLTVYFTWQNHGTAYVRYGVVTLLCLIFSVAGLVIGIMAKLEEDKFYLFAWIGIVLNALTLLGIGGIVAVGAVWIMTVMEERFELASQRILEIEKEKSDAGAVSTLFCRKRRLPGRPARRIQMDSVRGDAGSLSARAGTAQRKLLHRPDGTQL